MILLEGHAAMMSETGVDGFDMERGMPRTLDDETARNHYQAKFEANTSKYDGEEMLRRYRFSVVITKLVEVLYRRGYDLEGDFKAKVKMCNSASEDRDTETTIPRKDVLLAIGAVEIAMGEAIKIAFRADSYSFFSAMRPMDNYAFDIKELQSFIAFKSRGKITGELAHVMHYYEVETVPSFKELVDKHKRKQENKPVHLKFLHDTPLSLHRGMNMIMPSAPPSKVETQQDEQMVDVVEEESVAMEVEEVTEFSDPAPPPPMEPIIDDVEDEEMEVKQGTDAPTGERVVERIDESEQDDDVAAGPSSSSKGIPVVLKPARPQQEQQGPAKLMTARPKPKPN